MDRSFDDDLADAEVDHETPTPPPENVTSERIEESCEHATDEDEKETTSAKPRQWLIDRMFGKSPPPESIPPSWVCYVPPCISLAPDFFEQNCFCERMGKIGVIDPDESVWRKRLMKIGVFFNVSAISLCVTACFAISTQFHILQAIPFSKGEMTVDEFSTGRSDVFIRTDIGLQAIAYEDDLGSEVISFDEFCDYQGTGLERLILPEDCSSCADVSGSLIFTLIVSPFPYLPSIFANFIRMYPNYDINCMKTFCTLVNAISMVLPMYTFLAYRFQCFFTFFEGDIYFSSNYTEVDQDSDLAVGVAHVDWSPGSGLICIILATALMGVDVILHLLVPTPTITRDHDKQAEYEETHSSDVTMSASPKQFIGEFVGMALGRKKSAGDGGEAEDDPQ